jgi:hypothetical protein
MRVLSLTIALVATAVGCSDDEPSFNEGTGGTSGAAGGAGTGGAATSGGSTGSGGAAATGGSAGANAGGAAGKVGSGGAPGTGGVAGGANGGSAGTSTGGKGGSGGGKGGGGTSSGGKGGASGAGGSSKGGTGGVIQDAGADDGGGDASLPVPTVEQLFPLAVGNVWNYNVTVLPGTVGTPPCAAGMRATTITGRTTFANQDAFTATHVCAPTATRYYSENAQGLQVNLGTTWSLVLPRPISDGGMFQAASSQQVIARVAAITVPAGTFSNCWQTAYVSATGAVTTYCAGVGLVSLEYQAPSGGGYKLELVSYMLK